ncbi:TIGR03089 family protein [Dietzia sp.]|uniref:TIGR03089 family protein n=1 Tax=Dietzia sp. TaxID=1871616 RepID=UPI002FD9B9AF
MTSPSSPATLTDSLLAERMAADPAAPLITHYDLGEDSRIELSVVTTLNWAAKIGGLLRDGLGAMPGDTVVVDLSSHWLSVTIPLGIWWAGCAVALPGGPGAEDAVATICTVDRIDAHDDADELFVAGLDAFAMAPLDLPPGVSGLVAEARPYPDSFSPTPGGGAPEPLAWTSPSAVGKRSGRVLSVDPDTRELVESLVAVFSGGGSLVLASTGTGADWSDSGQGPETDDSAARATAEWLDGIRATEKVDRSDAGA